MKIKLRDLILLSILEWFKLGLRLGIDEHDLKKIQRKEHEDADACSCAMFSLWLDQFSDASLQKLIEALCDVGEFKAARQLHEKFGKSLC